MSARDIFQDLRNDVDTQSKGWDGFKAAAAAGYENAYGEHTKALGKTANALALDNAGVWVVFTTFWTIMAATVAPEIAPLSAWVGRLLEDAKKSDGLGKELVGSTWDMLTDKAKELAKDSVLDVMRKGADEARPWEPVVVSPSAYKNRMEMMLSQLAKQILRPIDDLIAHSNLSDANALYLANQVRQNCPYLTDLPSETGDDFIKQVQNSAELAMWMEWALRRDQPWWENANKDITIGNEMTNYGKILDRLMFLNVNVAEVTTMRRVGDGFLNQGMRVFDMTKMIDWARRNSPRRGSAFGLRKAYHLLLPKTQVRDQQSCRMQ